MAYTVLARKYRGWVFDDLVGQESVAATLKNAITSRRIHHGYLFCGTRGVGKTSAARILARSLNCLSTDEPTVTPCRQCESCTAIAEGQDVDVIEIDAASNTGVDNIRELRSNANYRPARARFKIYIIDEVHMLSTGAFNALLKTLEEPPGHVKFILATTESQKVPATIQSRCLRFDFRSISVDEIAKHFTWICEQEKVQADPAAIRRVARLANGSMRDGLSLLDQLLSTGADRFTIEMLEDLMPMAYDEVLSTLIGQLADRDAAGALLSLDKCLSAGYSLERFCESLTEQLRALMLLKVCGPETNLVELPAAVADSMRELAKRFDPESYVYMISLMEELRRNVRYSALGRALVEAVIVRLAGMASYTSIQRLLDELSGTGGPATNSKPPQTPTKAITREQEQPAAAPVASRPRTTSAATAGRQATGGETVKPPAGPPSGEDLKAATSEPMVREALDLFNGSLINVERTR
ncbi:MAG: DNA polymerase III subunit gamma/tau [Phycisphaerales bacterium]|nr:DNA polymerase III subunit gamma/tau [Phycisphaerales bacterium]